MYVDATTVITNLDGQPVHVGDAKTPLTIGAAIVEAMLASSQDAKMSARDKLDYFDLSVKFHKPIEPVRIDNVEADKIKEAVARVWPILITGRVLHAINEAPHALPVPVNDAPPRVVAAKPESIF